MKALFTLVFFSTIFWVELSGQSLTEIHYPKYVQGVGSSNASDDRKVPFACRMQVNGLIPNATYRYYPRFVADTSLATNGQGYYIIVNNSGNFTRVTSASLSTVGRYGEFTTNGSGSYTGWFIIEPSLALEFQPGTPLFFRLMLNNGAGGGSVALRITNSNPVTVLGWGSGANQGSGLRVVPNPGYIPKNFVMLYDNEAGTGRPVSGTFVESDGTDNNATTSGYAPFYANSVDGINNTWGTIIPNNLSTGIRRISQFDLTSGNSISGLTTTNGVFSTLPSGTISTANANTGLNELVIAAAPLPVNLVFFKGQLRENDKVLLQWRSEEEVNFSSFQIEKSSNGKDFIEIGEVAASGSYSNYSFNDILSENVGFYRLRMTDIDESYEYSDIIRISKKTEKGFIIYPNPATDVLNADIRDAGENSFLSIIDLSGKILETRSIGRTNGIIRINVGFLQPGTYILMKRTGSSIERAVFQKL